MTPECGLKLQNSDLRVLERLNTSLFAHYYEGKFVHSKCGIVQEMDCEGNEKKCYYTLLPSAMVVTSCGGDSVPRVGQVGFRSCILLN